MVGGIPRAQSFVSQAQEQTRDAFGFKWEKRDTFEGGVTDYMVEWLAEKYGSAAHWLDGLGPSPVVLDAGCGASMSGLAFFGSVLDRIRYLGIDVSTAVDVAARRFAERGAQAGFVQADLMGMPLAPGSVDLVFSEGVLHHTDDTRAALAAVTRVLRPGGRILFYVYRRKGPVREFTDDYIRDKLQAMSAAEGWAAMEPLTKLGRALGELNVEIDIPEAIDLLDIPAGKMNLQRFFYWHVCKAFYRPEMTLDEMNHINFDWFAPKNAHRQTPEEVRAWCGELGLTIERETVEEAGITIVARKGP
ncbi:MAG: class I SAM-dependent methyltransferase [Salinarimonadaceae bacterium]|nr:MAG: class I SAM-dependent methyltransferase [Salinarimonadaceae bacterium]